MTPIITAAFEAQQVYKYTLRTSNATQRINKLSELKNTIQQYEQEIYGALQADLRKSTFEAAVTEVFFIYSELDYAIKNLSGWMRPKIIGKTISSLFAKNRIYYEPKGVCLIISPWNYPFQLMMSPLISAIAAGNCVILKPSEMSPETSSIISKIVEETFDEQEVFCLEGDAAIATQLLALPFDHIFFTGSTAIGKIVMQAASKNLASITLELGGKSPVLIDETANLKKAAEKIAWGKLLNAGQTCIAPDYILIPETLRDQFIEQYRQAAEKMFFKNGEPDNSVYARIINQKHFDRLKSLISDAVSKGANIAYGGKYNEAQTTIFPTIITQPPTDAEVMKEEIFGPILPLITYQDTGQAIKHINDSSKPLALYIFSSDKRNIRHIIKNTSSGGVCVNDVLIHISNPRLPFGGVNASGMGSCHGKFGFKAFSHERAVVFQSKINMSKIIYPPYLKENLLLNWLKKLM